MTSVAWWALGVSQRQSEHPGTVCLGAMRFSHMTSGSQMQSIWNTGSAKYWRSNWTKSPLVLVLAFMLPQADRRFKSNRTLAGLTATEFNLVQVQVHEAMEYDLDVAASQTPPWVTELKNLQLHVLVIMIMLRVSLAFMAS